MENEEPRDLCYENKELYEKLTREKGSPFFGREYREIFMVAMALGFKNKSMIPLKKKIPQIPLRAFSTEEKWVIKFIAIKEEKNIEILSNLKKAYNIAEEYANGGLKILSEMVFAHTTNFDEVLEEELRQ